ncbi:MAG: ABC transporter ATP-binding protein [Thermoflexaceae bacterium]|nr:ABC transporter ATP-binding protein [Thermoflexaceae bacterium]
MRDFLRKHRERGAIIILACHDTEELEYLSDVIITISEGKIVQDR